MTNWQSSCVDTWLVVSHAEFPELDATDWALLDEFEHDLRISAACNPKADLWGQACEAGQSPS